MITRPEEQLEFESAVSTQKKTIVRRKKVVVEHTHFKVSLLNRGEELNRLARPTPRRSYKNILF